MKHPRSPKWPSVFVLVTAACTLLPDIPTIFDGIERLRAEHPRLHFTAADQERIEALARTDPDLQILIRNLMQEANGMLDEPVITEANLQSSRRVLARVTTLSLAMRLSEDESARQRYLDRVLRELQAAAVLPDWNPRHFLDVAEMTAAFAIGYDWLYGVLQPDERRMIREAIVQKGLQPGMEVYTRDVVWVERRPSNWNQVCNAGLVLGALAVADEEPGVAASILEQAKKSAPNGMHVYRQNGGYREGPMYWWYGTTFNVLLIDALQTALDTDWGMGVAEGFDNTGAFYIHATSPDRNRLFNYGDSHEESRPAPALYWLARRFNRGEYADFQRMLLQESIRRQESASYSRLSAFDIVWYVPPQDISVTALPLDVVFRGKGDVVMMRSAWDDPDALYVTLQGHWNQGPHAQLDNGSFVLDADGVRWVRELGSDRYSLPDFWDYREGGVRWTYYRNSSLSHNTLVLGDWLQRADASAQVVSFRSDPEGAHAILDLTESYAGQANRVRRGLAMPGRSRVLIQDELDLLDTTTPVRWGIVTDATVELDGSTAILSKDGKTLRAEILSPAGARFDLLSTDPGDTRQNRNEGTRMLATTVLPAGDRSLTLAVLLTPVGARWPEAEVPALLPLDAWEDGNAP